jgi:hypothetical protein
MGPPLKNTGWFPEKVRLKINDVILAFWKNPAWLN